MEQEKICNKIVYEKVGRENYYRKIIKKYRCPAKKKNKRCQNGKLKFDDPKTNRKAGDKCLDSGED